MSFTLIQAGDKLFPVNNAGVQGAELTLPAGVTLRQDVVPRFTRINRYLILVNTPNAPLSIDELGIVRYLTVPGPTAPLVMTNAAGGSLTGTYLAVYTYITKDISGNVISESDFSPVPTAAVTIAGKYLKVTGILPSTLPITGIRIYRTTTGPGAVYFKWKDIDGNATTEYQDDLADAGLGIVGAPALGPAPDLTLIREWQGRLWGVDRVDVDHLRFTEAGTMYGWSALNTIPIPHVGDDATGVTGLIPRRNALGVGRRTSFAQITGVSLANFQCVTVPGGEQASFVSQDSCVVRNDVAMFLGMDGIYRWDSTGIASISDGKVRSWFATSDYFNRSLFYRAFAQLDRFGLKYRLFLSSPFVEIHDRWVEFDLTTLAWFGPHRTNAFVPTCGVEVAGADGQLYSMIGSQEGYVSMEQEARNDWDTIPIFVRIQTKAHGMGEPDLEKYWGELSVNGQPQPSGDVYVVPVVGDVTVPPAVLTGDVIPIGLIYHMPNGRQRIARMGVGKHLTLIFAHEVINEDVLLYGYEVNPVNVIGRR